MYKEVYKHSSTGSTQQEPDCGGVGRKSIIQIIVKKGLRVTYINIATLRLAVLHSSSMRSKDF
ncbi:MAG: hypothetical protein LBL32_03135 [Holosporales bacterium]|nr:hypothetical protein [Holosporales bacterium]